MHELAIAEHIAGVVMTKVQEHNIEHVTRVHLQIGEAMAVVEDSLSFSYEMLASFTPQLAGSRLVIEFIPHRARCRGCQQEFHIEQFVLLCPHCGQWDVDVIAGTEFRIVDMEYEDASPSSIASTKE